MTCRRLALLAARSAARLRHCGTGRGFHRVGRCRLSCLCPARAGVFPARMRVRSARAPPAAGAGSAGGSRAPTALRARSPAIGRPAQPRRAVRSGLEIRF